MNISSEDVAQMVVRELTSDPNFRRQVAESYIEDSRLMTIREVCTHLGCSRRTFERHYSLMLERAPRAAGIRYRVGDVVKLTEGGAE